MSSRRPYGGRPASRIGSRYPVFPARAPYLSAAQTRPSRAACEAATSRVGHPVPPARPTLMVDGRGVSLPYSPKNDPVYLSTVWTAPAGARRGSETGSPGRTSRSQPAPPPVRRLARACLPPRCFGAFLIGEQSGPSRLPDLVLQREFWPASPHEPRGDDEHVMIGQELPGRPGSSEAVDHGHPDIRVKAERPDLADQVAASKLELALERLFIRGGGDLFVRRQAVTGRAVGSPRGKVQGPATPAAVRERHRELRSGIGRLLRGDLFLTKIAAKGLSAVRADRTV